MDLDGSDWSRTVTLTKDVPMNHTETRTTRLGALRRWLQARREARLRRLSLEHDLAMYRSPSELQEMRAMFSRYDDRETLAMRDMVGRDHAA
jgi:hypothetical protein